MKRMLGALSCAFFMSLSVQADITRVWLTHRSNDPSRIVVNWISELPGESEVLFGPTSDYGERVKSSSDSIIHHVEIPIEQRDAVIHYCVKTGNQRSMNATFKTCPTDELRIAVVADWQGKPDLSALQKDDVHLLVTAGDNIACLWRQCGNDKKDCIDPYIELIDTYPELFRSTPLMPVLGNHDRELRPRGKSPPKEPVYDIEATAFRRFFELPGSEWKWQFTVPGFGLRLVALDLNHLSDAGTTWQTCHRFDEQSEQFRWYESLLSDEDDYVVTLYNERHATIRNKAGGKWHDLFRRGTCCITGFGYFAERAIVDDFTYYNTSLNGKGDQYPDPHSKLLAGEDSYLLMSINSDRALTIRIKKLDGSVLDVQRFEP